MLKYILLSILLIFVVSNGIGQEFCNLNVNLTEQNEFCIPEEGLPPDNIPIRLLTYYSQDDTIQFGLSQIEYETAIRVLTTEVLSDVNRRAGIIDNNTEAYEIVDIIGLPTSSFGGLSTLSSIIQAFRSNDDGILDEELIQFDCTHAQACLILPPFSTAHNGVASSNVTVVTSRLMGYFYENLQSRNASTNQADSILYFDRMRNASRILIHEMGHIHSCGHMRGERRSLKNGVYHGPSIYGNSPSVMRGFGPVIPFYSNIHGPEPLTDGIVDNATIIKADRNFKHLACPAFNVTSILDESEITADQSANLTLDTNYPLWMENGTLDINIYLNGSLLQDVELPVNLNFQYDNLIDGVNEIFVEVIKNCNGNIIGYDTVELMKSLSSSSEENLTKDKYQFTLTHNKISLKNIKFGTIAQIYDISGRLINSIELKSDRNIIDISGYNSGVYLMSLVENNQLITFKFSII